MATWKAIYFEQGYEIDENGNVKNSRTGTILKAWITNSGYMQIQIRKNAYSIHRLVAKVYHSLSEFSGGLVLHLDGNRLNNNYLNLKWGTQSENIKMDYDKGIRSKRGEKHHLTKFKTSDIITIRKRLSDGDGVCKVARDYKVCHQTISNIRLNKSWV